jgi:hypothetical protein
MLQRFHNYSQPAPCIKMLKLNNMLGYFFLLQRPAPYCTHGVSAATNPQRRRWGRHCYQPYSFGEEDPSMGGRIWQASIRTPALWKVTPHNVDHSFWTACLSEAPPIRLEIYNLQAFYMPNGSRRHRPSQSAKPRSLVVALYWVGYSI